MLDRCVLCHFAELFTLLHQTSDVHQNHSHGSIEPRVGHQTAGALKYGVGSHGFGHLPQR